VGQYTLKSLAIPKGPSLDPTVKRLAVAVDDHELDYAHFEGVIGEGEYGSGPVLVWDTGEYEYLPNPKALTIEQALVLGTVNVVLSGKRLRGRFTLLKIKRKPGEWLIIKARDSEARVGSDVTKDYETSVLSNRTLDELKMETALGKFKPHRCS
jgi:bifunctional non-homologous end joining protein LigD